LKHRVAVNGCLRRADVSHNRLIVEIGCSPGLARGNSSAGFADHDGEAGIDIFGEFRQFSVRTKRLLQCLQSLFGALEKYGNGCGK
jgi:hypothetical protein